MPATIDERIAKDVRRLNLGTIEETKVRQLVREYYGRGLTEGMNDMTDQQRRLEGDH